MAQTAEEAEGKGRKKGAGGRPCQATRPGMSNLTVLILFASLFFWGGRPLGREKFWLHRRTEIKASVIMEFFLPGSRIFFLCIPCLVRSHQGKTGTRSRRTCHRLTLLEPACLAVFFFCQAAKPGKTTVLGTRRPSQESSKSLGGGPNSFASSAARTGEGLPETQGQTRPWDKRRK